MASNYPSENDNNKKYNLGNYKPNYIREGSSQDIIKSNAWNTENDDIFSQWFNSGSQQTEEYAQQIQLMQMQNEYNFGGGKLQDLIDSGVNPNTAAAAVAGGSNASAPSSNSAIGSGAAGLSAAAGVVDAAGNIVDKLSQTNQRNTLLQESLNNLAADTFLKWKEAGFNDIQSKSMALAMRYLPAEKMLGIMNLAASAQKINAEYESFMQGIEESKKRIQQIDADIEVAKATADYTTQLQLEAEKRTLGIDIENQQKQWRLNKMRELNIDPNNPLEYNMYIGALEGNQTLVDNGANIIYETHYSGAKGQFSAEAENAYEIAKNREKGKQESEDEYRQRKQWYEEHRDAMKEFWQWYYKTPSSIREAAMKYIFEDLNHIGSFNPRKLNYEPHR